MEVQDRPAQPYAGIRVEVTMAELGRVVPPLWPEVFAWLGRQGLEAAGAPLLRYLVVDMQGLLQLEVGVPIPDGDVLPSDARVRAAELPAGRYATLVHTGPPEELVAPTARLLEWGSGRGLRWQLVRGVWGGRVERYLTDPAQEPDRSKWQTEVALLVADG